MPAVVKPLFRPDAVRPLLAGFAPPPASVAARPKLDRWAAHLKTPAGLAQKETELLPGFLRDVFDAPPAPKRLRHLVHIAPTHVRQFPRHDGHPLPPLAACQDQTG